ncbi:MAG TPA: glycoside hydrolase family 2 TIM barrel-domain containing protein [Chitinophagaceae bacterium]|jgi:beta-galactosidase|nr:glycoside hydrolase family 2 TIM barrel-domain containing protein [Chitinophagaceae bacterium]
MKNNRLTNFLKKYILFGYCIVAVQNTSAQRDTIALNNDWQFAIDKNAVGLQQQWFAKALPNATSVSLPHTWNIHSATQNHYGWGWYQTKINAPAAWKNKTLRLQFGAVNHTCYIYLNGKKIDENIGDGFSKFYVDLTGKLQAGKENVLTIAVNNEYGTNKVPFGSSFDWPNDGGLIRKVALLVTGKPAAQYLHATPKINLQDNSGSLGLQLKFDKPDGKLKFAVSVQEENQAGNAVIYNASPNAVWNGNAATMQINLPAINAWHFDRPNLYRIVVSVLKGNTVIDKIATVTGFRDIQLKAGKFYLNGEHVKLMGVEWTAGSNPDFGFAETDAEIIRHCKLMKDVNAIFTRQHFQQDELFYDFCDRNGIIVQQEVPLWGPETPANDSIRNISLKQLERMVNNFYNHPSIFSWGVGNELRARDADMKGMIEILLKQSRALDPTRNTAYVSNTLTQGFYNNPNFVPDAAAGGDYLMMNEYGGSWWDLPTGKIHNYLDSVHMSYPDKPFFISEFGLCEPNFKGGDERRVEDLIYHMAIYESKPYVEGAIYFDLTDYRTHYPGTSDTTKYRRRIHGIYDMYGKPKPSMKILRELSSPVEVQGVRNWKKGKLNVLIFGSIGLPQHIVQGYKLYVSDGTANYRNGKVYDLPTIAPGERVNFEVDDSFNGRAVITVLRPTGYVVSQKVFE